MHFSSLGGVGSVDAIQWSPSVRKCSIFVKELLAAVIAIERAMRYPHTKTICIAVDNTAAAHVLRRRYSNNSAALEMMLRLDKQITAAHVDLEVISVPGSDNVADCPTRGKSLCPIRAARTWHQLQAARLGQSLEYEVCTAYTDAPPNDLRHNEQDSVVEELCAGLLEAGDESLSAPLETLIYDQTILSGIG